MNMGMKQEEFLKAIENHYKVGNADERESLTTLKHMGLAQIRHASSGSSTSTKSSKRPAHEQVEIP
jgi:hypothetical protein